MVKRIVSGIFILTALGALGVILAGALTSGEQLIVRFLTAVTVAALALYVISDLRLQSEQEEELPAERNGSTADRPSAQTGAPNGKGRNGGKRRVRRRADATVQPPPNFEAIEPVTARPRAVAHIDPTGAVTGSRLVPPAPDETDRLVPPHPIDGRTEGPDSRTAVPTAGSTAPPPMPSAGSSDIPPEIVVPPLESQAGTNGSAIATTSYTYSGKVDIGVEWPPKPPVSAPSAEPETKADLEAPRRRIDAPTAELTALEDVSRPGADDYLLPASLAAGLADGEPSDEAGAGSPELSPDLFADLFAVDTAELPPFEASAAAPVPDDRPSLAVLPAPGDPVDDIPPLQPASVDSTMATPLIRRVEAAHYAEPTRTDHLDLREPADEEVTPVEVDKPVPAAPPSGGRSPERLTAAIRSGEVQVINSLINQGMLTTSGPITDRDVRTMVYVAFTSNELRKLILAGGTPDGVRAGDLDLGEVELFDESRFAPPPKLLYAGPPEQPVEPEPIIDLVALENESATTESSSTTNLDREVHDADLAPALPTPKHLYRRVDADRVEQ